MVTFANEPFLFMCCLVAGFAMILSWFFLVQLFYAQRAPTPPLPEPNMCAAARDPYRTEEWHTYRHMFNVCGCKPS